MQASVTIQLAGGTEELGLAVMLKDLLAQNLALNPHKITDFKKLNITISLFVSDVDIELTMDFADQQLTIHPGITGNPKLHITSDAESVMNLSNLKIKWGLPYYFDEPGKEVLAAMKSGRLKVKGLVAHFPSLVRLSRLLSVH